VDPCEKVSKNPQITVLSCAVSNVSSWAFLEFASTGDNQALLFLAMGADSTQSLLLPGNRREQQLAVGLRWQ
jgi:hypothetical protein